MGPEPWKTLKTRSIYRNQWMQVREDLAELPNGRTTIYGICELGHCVGVLPFIDDEHVLMVKQYRYIQKENQRWEMPTGGMHPGESYEQAAQRELMEEVGYHAGLLVPINTHYTSKSVCDETAHLYIGRHLSRLEATPDDTEFLQVGVLPFAEVLHLVQTSEIRDSMTVIAVLLAAQVANQ
jgi:ADP-ribose pyrophosphatase